MEILFALIVIILNPIFSKKANYTGAVPKPAKRISALRSAQWMGAIYDLSGHKKGISSLQLGKDLGVTQKTAWFTLHRIRFMMG